jgi:hypothetical protein
MSIILKSGSSGNLANIDSLGNLYVSAAPAAISNTAAPWTSATLLDTVQILMGAGGFPAVIVQLNQTSTITGGAVTFEGTYEGINWQSLPAAFVLDPQTFATSSNPYVLQANTNHAVMLVAGGFQQIRARLNPAILGSGQVTIYWTLRANSPFRDLSTVSITGSVAVTGTFWQTTQPVSGAVSVSNFPVSQAVTGTFFQATQPVSGTVAVSNFPATQPVSGTFWQATQPVSAASLPLPAGAATVVKQPALGVAGTASADVITVQGTASMTPLLVDGSGVTQPVSGTFWQVTQPVSGTVAVSNFPVTQPVSGTFWQTTQPVSLASTTITGSVAVTGTFWPYSLGQQLSAASVPVVLTAAQLTALTPPAVFGGVVTQATGTNLHVVVDTAPTTAVTGTFYPYSLGQQLAAASVPVVLTAAQLTALTPPAALTNYSLETGGNLAIIVTNTGKIPALGQALAASSVPVVLTSAQLTTLTPPAAFSGVVTNGGTFAVQATLSAETTKVIGTVNVAASQSIAVTNAGTFTAQADIVKIAGTAVNVAAAGTLLVGLADGDGQPVDSLTAGSGQNGLLVAMGATNYVASANNSTTSQLASNATFSGVIETIFAEPDASILLVCDQPGVLTVNQYITASAGSLCASTAIITPATTGGNCYARSFVVNGNFFNVTFKNTGGSTTTTLNLNVAYGTIPAATQLLNSPTALNEINGTTASTGNGLTDAGTLRVSLSSDSTGQVKLAAGSTVSLISSPPIATTATLAAGTAFAGQISASDETSTVYNGTTALTPLFATIVASSSGVTNIIAAVGGKRIRVLALSLVANAAVNVKFQSHVTPSDLSGLYYLAANGGFILPYNPIGWFQTVSGEALDINLSAAVACGGNLVYVTV